MYYMKQTHLTGNYPYLVLISKKLTAPPFLPSNELAAPRFWHSLPSLHSTWQWVCIWYLSAPPPPPDPPGVRIQWDDPVVREFPAIRIPLCACGV